jgi:DNA-directed RNA polymerase specialized sigma24 family protein
VVELRFFGGLTLQETAGVLGISLATAKNDWTHAKAWLFTRLGRGDSSPPGPPGS